MSKLPFDPDQAAGLAALAAEDPERVQAFEQAESHPELMQALREGQRLMSLLDQVEVAPPTSAALERAAKSVLDEMAGQTVSSPADATSAAQPPGWNWPALTLPGSVLAVWAVLLSSTNHEAFESTSRVVYSLALLGLATVATIAISRLGGLVVAGAAVVASVVFAAAASTGAGLGPATEGLHCTLVTLAGAALPLAAATGLALTGRLQARGALTFGAIAAVGALAGVAALHLTCSGEMIGHLMVFHGGGVLLATLLGCGVGALPPIQRATAAAG